MGYVQGEGRTQGNPLLPGRNTPSPMRRHVQSLGPDSAEIKTRGFSSHFGGNRVLPGLDRSTVTFRIVSGLPTIRELSRGSES